MSRFKTPQEIMEGELSRMNPNQPTISETFGDFAPLEWLQSLGREKKDQQQSKAYADSLKQYGTDTSALESMIATAPKQEVMSKGNPVSVNPVIKDYLTKKSKSPERATASELSGQPSVSQQMPKSEDELSKAEQDYNDRTSGFNWQQALIGLGDAIAGRGPQNSIEWGRENDKRIYNETVGKVKEHQKQAKEDAIFKRQQDQFDPNSKASQSFRGIIEANFPQVAKAYGDKWKDVTAADSDNIFKPLQLKETIDARLQQAALMAQIRAEQKREKTINDDRQLEVPGFIRDSRYKPTEKEAVDAKKASATFKTLTDSLDRMDQLVKDNGSFEFGGNAGSEMETLNTTIQMNLKNLYELGALSGPDMAILQSQLNDPTSLRALFSKDSTVRGGVRALRNQLRSSFMNGMGSKGYVPKENFDLPAPQVQSQSVSKAPYGDVIEQGGHQYRWNPSKGQYE